MLEAPWGGAAGEREQPLPLRRAAFKTGADLASGLGPRRIGHRNGTGGRIAVNARLFGGCAADAQPSEILDDPRGYPPPPAD